MIFGIPPAMVADGDLPMWKGGAIAPSGLTLIGVYVFNQVTGQPRPPVTPTGITVMGQSGNTTVQGLAINGATLFIGYRTNGTYDTPTGVVNGDNLFLLGAAGRTSSGSYTGSTALISLVGTETYVAASNMGSKINFSGTPTGSAARAVWLTLENSTFAQLSGSAPTANTFSGNLLAGRNNAAADTAGFVGESTNSKISTATNAAGTGTYLALTSLTLAAGKWRLACYAEQVLNGATIVAASAIEALIGTTSASNAGTTAGYDRASNVNGVASTIGPPLTLSDVVVNITGSTTYYLNVLATFTVGTPQWRGSLKAERLA